MSEIENLPYIKKVEKFNKDYGYYNQSNRNRLRKLADKNRNLVNKFILGKPKNPFYTPRDTSLITERDNEYYALIQWTFPREKYTYKEVGLKEFLNDKAARVGIIPVVKKDDVNYWLLGSFADYENTPNPILADFGGGCKASDKSPLVCGERELREESKDLLTELFNDAIEDDGMAILQGTNYSGKTRIYFLFVELDLYDVDKVMREFPDAPPYKDNKEHFGNLRLYKQSDVKSGKYRTSKNLTDLLSYLRRLY